MTEMISMPSGFICLPTACMLLAPREAAGRGKEGGDVRINVSATKL